MYIVICKTVFDVWYDGFYSLQSALDYAKKYDDGYTTVTVFKCEEVER